MPLPKNSQAILRELAGIRKALDLVAKHQEAIVQLLKQPKRGPDDFDEAEWAKSVLMGLPSANVAEMQRSVETHMARRRRR